MNNFLIAVFVFVPLLIIALLQFRRSQKQLGDIQAGSRPLDDLDVRLINATQAEAAVISARVSISPKVPTIAKVDLELKIQQPGGGSVVRQTTWLVEVPSLSQLEAGRTIAVKLDPRKPERVYPAVPWARPWLFGKAGK